MFDFFKKKNDIDDKSEKDESSSGLSFEKLKEVISSTTQNLVNSVVSHVENEEEFDEFLLDDMEDLLIKADLGVGLAVDIVDKLRKQNNIKPNQVKNYLKNQFSDILINSSNHKLNYSEDELNVYFVVGVNGAGKTTLIGKLAYRFKQLGKKVLIVAGDTFRAAAEEQLEIWAKRADVDILRRDGADPSGLVYDAINKAKTEKYDVVLIDTAGRLQNKFNLMEELSKVKKVIDKCANDCLRETIMVLDANTGQNGLQQAKVFTDTVDVSCVGLTKLDGSAKGGIVISIAKDMNLPVKLIGVGEKIDDLKDFEPADFIEALFV